MISAYNLGDSTGTGSAAGNRRTVGRDNAGRITAYTHTNSGTPVSASDQGFGYDNLNRLVSATLGSTTTQYSYDATGNRSTKVIGATTYTNTIATTSNKLTQTQDVGSTATIQHDAAGNITSDGTNTFTYSDRGRMATMTNAGGTVTYSYNALEMRVGKTGPTALVPTGAAYYVYNEEGKLLGEYDANGVPLYETIYLGAPVGVIKQTGTAGASNIGINLYNVSTDQVGAPRVIARQSDEAIVWRWDSAEAFGATAPDQNPSSLGTFSFNQRFPGQVFDAESGLFQNWNREYNPRIGRYMQSDPIGLLGGVNTFAYVAGAPLGGIDPTGLDWQDSIRNWWSASLAGFQSQSASEFGMKMLQGLPQEAALLGAIGTLKKLGSTEQCIAKGVATQEALATKVLTEAGELRLSASVAEKYAATRPYVTPLTVQEAIAGGVRAPDPQGVAGRFMYTIDAMYAAGPGKVVAGINGSEAAVVVKNSIGKFEVLVNELTNTVEHALFKSNK